MVSFKNVISLLLLFCTVLNKLGEAAPSNWKKQPQQQPGAVALLAVPPPGCSARWQPAQLSAWPGAMWVLIWAGSAERHPVIGVQALTWA